MAKKKTPSTAKSSDKLSKAVEASKGAKPQGDTGTAAAPKANALTGKGRGARGAQTAAQSAASAAKTQASTAASGAKAAVTDAAKTVETSTAAAKASTPTTSTDAKKPMSTPAPSQPAKAETAKPDVAKDTAKTDASKKPDLPKADAVKKPEPAKPQPTKVEPAKTTKPEVAKTDPRQTSTPKPASAPAAAPAPAPARSGIGFVPVVLGVALAGGLGFLASELDVFGNRGDNGELKAQLDAQSAKIAELEAVEPVTVDTSELTAGIEALGAQTEQLGTQITDLDERLSVVERMPVSDGSEEGKAAAAAYARELAQLQTSVETQSAEIQALLDNARSTKEAAEAAARKAEIQAAVAKITAAVNTGQPFGDAVAALESAGEADIPAALTDTAESGVATLAGLQAEFPASARAALSAARAEAPSEEEQGVGGFLRRQLGARSTAPKEGSGPDAVLSRAEAAVKNGQLDEALTEIESLPDAAKGALQGWLDQAQARAAALGATQDLSERLTAE